MCQKHAELGQRETHLRERRETQNRTPPRRWHPTWRGEMPCQAPLLDRNAKVTHKRPVAQVIQMISAKRTPEHDHEDGIHGSGGGCQAPATFWRKRQAPNRCSSQGSITETRSATSSKRKNCSERRSTSARDVRHFNTTDKRVRFPELKDCCQVCSTRHFKFTAHSSQRKRSKEPTPEDPDDPDESSHDLNKLGNSLSERCCSPACGNHR